ncbi:MAG: dUTP diphosphatase [Phycisphaerales bacterium]|nr:dUTP diphosphatase [Phycisphaerales bacterium]
MDNHVTLRIKMVNRSNNPIPQYATTGSSGLDLRAFLQESIILAPFERGLIPTGLFLELPIGYEAQVRPRSGLALKQGITCLNSPGTIDADYRGEISVLLINLSEHPQPIRPGDRIAQLVIQTVTQVAIDIVTVLSETTRNEKGWGHTGIH